MDMAKYIGETAEYDKKQEVERRKVKKLADERQRLCQWRWRLPNVWYCR